MTRVCSFCFFGVRSVLFCLQSRWYDSSKQVFFHLTFTPKKSIDMILINNFFFHLTFIQTKQLFFYRSKQLFLPCDYFFLGGGRCFGIRIVRDFKILLKSHIIQCMILKTLFKSSVIEFRICAQSFKLTCNLFLFN